jgi:heptosyltransferase-1
MPLRVRRLGIVRLSAVGDVVLAMPLAMALRRAFPRARITWVVQAAAAPLLCGHPAVDDVLVFPRRGGARTWWRFLRELFARRFDVVVDPQGNAKSGLVGLLSGAPIRAGLHPRDCKEWVNAILVNRHGRRARGPHGVERAFAAGGFLGVGAGPDAWGLRATEEEVGAWRDRARNAGIDPAGPILAVNVTDPDDDRSWPTPALARCAALAAREKWQVVLNGPKSRAATGREIAASAPGVFDLVGTDDLRGLLAQFQDMAARSGNALLSADSGAVHLASAVGLPVVCVSGPQDPARTGPRYGVAVTAWEGLSCAPCLERACVRRPPDRACMHAIGPERVLEVIRRTCGARSRPACPST